VLVTQVVLTCSRQPSPDSPTCHCRLKKFLSQCKSAVASTAGLFEGRARHFTAIELQADLQLADRIQGLGETRVGTAAAHLLCSVNFSQFQSAPHFQLRRPVVAPPSGVETKLNVGVQLQSFPYPLLLLLCRPVNGLFSRTTRLVPESLDLNEARDDGVL